MFCLFISIRHHFKLFTFILTYHRPAYSSNEPMTIDDLLRQGNQNVPNSMEESRTVYSSDSENDSEEDTERNSKLLPDRQTHGPSTSRAVPSEDQRYVLFHLN